MSTEMKAKRLTVGIVVAVSLLIWSLISDEPLANLIKVTVVGLVIIAITGLTLVLLYKMVLEIVIIHNEPHDEEFDSNTTDVFGL